MAKIIISSEKCNLQDEPDVDFLKALDKELSYKVKGAEFTAAFQGYYNAKTGKYVKWDGWNKLLDSKLEFHYGLVQRVQEFYSSNGKELELEDTRTKSVLKESLNILPQLKAMGKDPYPHQLQGLQACIDNDFGILKMSVGSGKSILSAMMTAHFNKKTIIYVIGQDLLYQFHKLYSDIFPDQKIGIIGDGYCQISDINIASIWTIGTALGIKSKDIFLDTIDKEKELSTNKYQQIRDLLQSTKVHIFDECHMAACKTIQEIAKAIKPEYLYGMSASPWRDDGADLLIESILGHKIIDISASYLIKNNFLVKPHIKFIKVPRTNISSREYQTIYKNYIIDNPERNNIISTGAVRLVEQKFKTLVLFNKLVHGNILYEDLKNKVNCALLSGKDSNELRRQAIDALENDKVQCILASKIFDIGVDIPQMSGLILAGGGASTVRALQRVGRVLRKYPNKKIAAVIDFQDQAKFLDEHAKIRYKVYRTESEFEINWNK